MAVWTHIAHTAVSLPATTVQFGTHGSAPISQSYDHLYLVMSGRWSSAGSEPHRFSVIYNGNTTSADYSNNYLVATSGTVQADRNEGDNLVAFLTTTDFEDDTFAATSLWIPYYSNTANFKQMVSRSVCPNTSASDNEWGMRSTATLFHENTDAIDEIRLVAGGGHNFVANSTFDLYGILGV